MDRLERFELYVLFMLLLIAISLLLKSIRLNRIEERLYDHALRLDALESYNETSPLEPLAKEEVQGE